MPIPTYDEYVATLGRLTAHVDPTTPAAESAAIKAAAERPGEIIAMLDAEFRLVENLEAQIGRDYSFGDVLVARAGTRVTAVSASTSGRVLEDRIEAIAIELGLTYR